MVLTSTETIRLIRDGPYMYTSCVYVWEGGGCGLGWGGVVIGCVSERKMYGCACVLIAIFLMCLN